MHGGSSWPDCAPGTRSAQMPHSTPTHGRGVPDQGSPCRTVDALPAAGWAARRWSVTKFTPSIVADVRPENHAPPTEALLEASLGHDGAVGALDSILSYRRRQARWIVEGHARLIGSVNKHKMTSSPGRCASGQPNLLRDGRHYEASVPSTTRYLRDSEIAPCYAADPPSSPQPGDARVVDETCYDVALYSVGTSPYKLLDNNANWRNLEPGCSDYRLDASCTACVTRPKPIRRRRAESKRGPVDQDTRVL